jgi:hypothetical protein
MPKTRGKEIGRYHKGFLSWIQGPGGRHSAYAIQNELWGFGFMDMERAFKAGMKHQREIGEKNEE